jgi:hypothetical protein
MAEMENAVVEYRDDYARACSEFMKFRRSEQDAISFLVKEFEMRKAADTYAKTAIAKTGVINTNQLHSYRYNDDIFKRQKTVPLGKNHGFIMFLDWSGSMRPDLMNTMKQLRSIVLFCKKVQVPFEVYLFKTGYCKNAVQPNFHKDSILLDNFKLRNVLSSKMNMSTLNKAFTYLWTAAKFGGLRCDTLDGTPLNQAILAADQLVNKFRSENKLQIVNTVFLTDGVSDNTHINWSASPSKQSSGPVLGSRYFIEDHQTNKNYYIGEYFGSYRTTETLLKMLKDRTDSNLVGFFITTNVANLFGMVGIYDTPTQNMLTKQFRDNAFVQVKSAGYDSYFVINMRRQSHEQTLKVNRDMTQRAVLKEFVKYSEKKLTNRSMLTEFIKLVVA